MAKSNPSAVAAGATPEAAEREGADAVTTAGEAKANENVATIAGRDPKTGDEVKPDPTGRVWVAFDEGEFPLGYSSLDHGEPVSCLPGGACYLSEPKARQVDRDFYKTRIVTAHEAKALNAKAAQAKADAEAKAEAEARAAARAGA